MTVIAIGCGVELLLSVEAALVAHSYFVHVQILPDIHSSINPFTFQIYVNQRDALWDTWTCVLGFPVMGVWRKYSDGTDVNALCR